MRLAGIISLSRLLGRAAGVMGTVVLAACVSLPDSGMPSSGQSRSESANNPAQLIGQDTSAVRSNLRFASQEASPKVWSGRFSVSLRASEAGGSNESAQGRFQLEASGEPPERSLALTLSSPFGQRIAQGSRQADGASRLALADGRVLRDISLDGVVEQALGWPLPLERLPQWLDDRFDEIVLRDAQGAITQAVDSGWLIEREPGRWSLVRNHAKGHLRVVLVLDR